MRHESSTVIALVGHVPAGLLDALAESGNVSVVRLPAGEPAGTRPGAAGPATPARPGTPALQAAAGPGWEHGALAMREAARRRSTYVVVAADPLAGVAAAWRAMWDVAAGPGAAADFEQRAADALVAWREQRLELPDYYLVIAPALDSGTGPDLYLGPLRAARPHRVAVAAVAAASGSTGQVGLRAGQAGVAGQVGSRAGQAGVAGQAGLAGTAGAAAPASPASLLDTLRSLEHGPWWPPLDELLETARRFYAGGLAETQQTPV